MRDQNAFTVRVQSSAQAILWMGVGDCSHWLRNQGDRCLASLDSAWKSQACEDDESPRCLPCRDGLKEGAEAAFNNLRRFELKGTQVSVDWSTMAKTEMGMCNKRQEKPPAPATRSFKENPTEESLGFRLGQVVLISNLKGAPQFNGSTACVVGFRSDRVEVELEADGAKKTLALKPENLSAKDAAPPTEPEEKPAEPRKRRAKWEENSGGFVVPQEARKAPSDSGAPFPPVAELEQMPMKELKALLKDHGVDTTGCLEKAEFLQKAKERAKL